MSKVALKTTTLLCFLSLLSPVTALAAGGGDVSDGAGAADAATNSAAARAEAGQASRAPTGMYFGLQAPVSVPEPFAPEILGGGREILSCVVFSPYRDDAYWVLAGEKSEDGGALGEIYFMRVEEGSWTPPERAPFSGAYDDGFPYISRDKKRLFFLSDRPLEPGEEAGSKRIWTVERSKDDWSEPSPLDSMINAREIHGQFWLDRTHHLFFASNSAGGQGQHDIYLARNTIQRYLEPQNLGASINTAADESHPYVSPDGKVLIFARSEGQGSESHLFVSFYNQGDGTWSQAKELSKALRSAGNEYCAMITTDGMNFIYLGSRNGVEGLFWRDAMFVKHLKRETVWYD